MQCNRAVRNRSARIKLFRDIGPRGALWRLLGVYPLSCFPTFAFDHARESYAATLGYNMYNTRAIRHATFRTQARLYF